LIDICDGNHCAAALLDILIYWDSIKRGAVQQEMSRARLDNLYSPKKDLWIYKSSEDWADDLNGHYGDRSIRDGLKFIVGKEFALTRSNPTNPFDRTPQYMLNYQAVVDALSRLGGGGGGSDKVNSYESAKMPNVESAKMPTGESASAECSFTEVTITENTKPSPTPSAESQNQNPPALAEEAHSEAATNPVEEQRYATALDLDLEDDIITFVEHAYSRENRGARLDSLRTRRAEPLCEQLRRAELEWGPVYLRTALIRYLDRETSSEWTRENHWPIRAFLKYPELFEPCDNSPRLATPAPALGASEGVGGPIHPPAPPARPAASERAVDPPSLPAAAEEWNRVVTAGPKVEQWTKRDASMDAAAADPDFLTALPKVLEVCQKAFQEREPEEVDWLNFRWLLRRKATLPEGWYRIYNGELSFLKHKSKPKSAKQQGEDYLEKERIEASARREALKRSRAAGQGSAGSGTVGNDARIP
jgi:hypothetical protein